MNGQMFCSIIDKCSSSSFDQKKNNPLNYAKNGTGNSLHFMYNFTWLEHIHLLQYLLDSLSTYFIYYYHKNIPYFKYCLSALSCRFRDQPLGCETRGSFWNFWWKLFNHVYSHYNHYNLRVHEEGTRGDILLR